MPLEAFERPTKDRTTLTPIERITETPIRVFEQKGETAMDPHADESPSIKGRRSKAPKASTKKAAKLKVSLMLTEDIDFRLTVHAAAMKLDRSELVNQILDGALKRFVVQDRGQARGGEGASDDAEAAA